MLAALRPLQRSIFRKNGYIKLIIVTREVDCIVCGTNKQSRGELKHGQTDRHTQTQLLAAHARRGLITKEERAALGGNGTPALQSRQRTLPTELPVS